METFAFFAITFEPIGILTHSAHQNDRLNLSFVKDKHTVGKKWPELVVKRPFILSFLFRNRVYILVSLCKSSEILKQYDVK